MVPFLLPNFRKFLNWYLSSGRCRLRKTEIIFSAHNDRVTWRKVVSKNFDKMLTYNIFGPSHPRYVPMSYQGITPASELVLLRRGLPSDIALQGGSLESKFLQTLVNTNPVNVSRNYIFEVCTYRSIHNFGLEASPL